MIKLLYKKNTKLFSKFLILYLLSLSQITTSQVEEVKPMQAKVVKAEKKYDNFAYIDAIQTYERIAKKGYKSVDLFSRLGNAYYFNGQSEKANKWYSELFAMQLEVDIEYYYRYAQTLKSVNDYKKADTMLALFYRKSGSDERAKIFDQSKNYLETIKDNSGRYKVQNLAINGQLLDYGSTVRDNKLIFASSRDEPSYVKRTMKWNNQPFTNIYEAEINPDGTTGDSKLFSNTINTKFDESTPVFTKDGNTVYFTRSNSFESKLGFDVKGTTGLKIYKSTFENNKWTTAKSLPINSDQYSTAHPALSSDGKTLYFASDMPGSMGASDLFQISIDGNDKYGTPINLGREINTPGRETFPFVSAENDLYFASDARQGLGGLDIYVSKLKAGQEFTYPVNIGEPVNGTSDDFAFYIDSNTKKGFFSSNRVNGKGYDDIYSITELSKLKCEQSLAGIVTDENTGEFIAGAELILSDSKFNEIKKVTSDASGKYNFAVNCSEKYYIKTSKEAYEVNETKLTIENESGSTKQPISLVKKIIAVAVGGNIADALKIKMIYFDLDKSFIRQDAVIELEKVLDVLNQYPTMTIDIRSHTDSRQTTLYNASLSERRAKSTLKWLIKSGISKDRLTAKGYGESQLTNKCADNVDCTEDEHQTNRRSEFIIVKM